MNVGIRLLLVSLVSLLSVGRSAWADGYVEAKSAKFFRLTFKKVNNTVKQLQFAELALLDGDGNRVFASLSEAAKGTSAADLAPGTFSVPKEYGVNSDSCYKAFDGLDSTKFCSTSVCDSQGTESTWAVFTLRLPEGAATPTRFNYMTANDSNERSPKAWTVEASYDGGNWFVVLDCDGQTVYPSDYRTWARGWDFTAPAFQRETLTIGSDGWNADYTNGVDGAEAVLEKVGTGALFLNGHSAPGRVDVCSGALATAPNAVRYSHYRFKVTETIGGTSSDGLQIGEFKLLCNGLDVTRAYSSVSRSSVVKQDHPTHPVSNATDGDLTTKFLDGNLGNGRTAEQADNCWIRLDYPSPVPVTHYNWATGNDCYDPALQNCRNPRDWKFQGSDDGVNWTDLDVRNDVRVSPGQYGWASEKGYALNVFEPRYRHFRLKIEAIVSPRAFAAGLQISELALYHDGENDVTRPFASVSRSEAVLFPSSSAEEVDKAVDGKLSTKFFDYNMGNRAKTAEEAAYYADNCWIRLDYDEPIAVSGYNWATCEDCYNPAETGCRNPRSWRFQASDDGMTWVDLDVRTDEVVDVGPRAWAKEGGYAIDYGERARTKFDELENSVVGLSGGATFNLAASTVVAAGFSGAAGSSVALDDAELEIAGKGELWGVSGTGGLVKSGDGVLTVSGAPGSFGGSVTAKGGILALGHQVRAKFFRLTFKKVNNTVKQLQFAELALLDGDGNPVFASLSEAAKGTSAADLAPGTFSVPKEYGVNSDSCYKAFDGLDSTKFCSTSVCDSQGTESTWAVFTLRLPEGAATPTSFNYMTANDSNERSPKAWTVEASYDGGNWFVVLDCDGQTVYPSDYRTWARGWDFTAPADAVERSCPFSATATYEVDFGAMLDATGLAASPTVAGLRIGATAGGGVYRGVQLAENGTIYVVDAPEGFRGPVGIGDFSASSDAENLAKWTVSVNGRKGSGWRVDVRNDGTAELSKGGSLLILR